jgi:ankyrin repeat protein
MRLFKTEKNNVSEKSDDTDIFELIDKGELGLVVQCLQNNPEEVHQKNPVGQTPLHLAVSFTDPTFLRLEIIKLLLSEGAKLDAQDQDGMTPIHAATKAAFAPKALELLMAHAWMLCFNDKNPEDFSDKLFELIDKQDVRGRTALHYALSGGRIESAEILLMNGASLQVFDQDLATPLFLCFKTCINENTNRALGLCLAYGKTEDIIYARDGNSNSLLHYACLARSPAVVHALLLLGLKADILNDKNETPSDWVQRLRPGSEEIIHYLKNPSLVKEGNISLPSFEKKELDYLTSEEGIDSLEDILSPQRFLSNKTVLEKPYSNGLSAEFKGGLGLLPALMTLFHESAKRVESLDPLLFQQLNFRAFLIRYAGVIDLTGSSEGVTTLLTMAKKILQHDFDYAFLTENQFKHFSSDIHRKISQDKEQFAILSGEEIQDISKPDIRIISIRSASDQDLANIFPAFKISTIRNLDADPAALQVFKLGLNPVWTEHLMIKDKTAAVRNFFGCVRKFISIIQVAQELFEYSMKDRGDEQAALMELKSIIDELFCNPKKPATSESNLDEQTPSPGVMKK